VATLDDVRFALIAIEESRRDVYCNPQPTAGVKALVDELGLSGVVAVPGRSIVSLGQAYVVDPNALEASLKEVPRPPGRVAVDVVAGEPWKGTLDGIS
jgi:hypothetical protein